MDKYQSLGSKIVNFGKAFDCLNLEEPEEYDFDLPEKAELLRFIYHQLSLNQKRADYREFLQLARMFIIGENLYLIKRPRADSAEREVIRF